MTTAPASRPRLLVVAGPNGAGKTTITERGLAHEWFHDCEYINPDAIAQDELGDWNDAVTVLHAAKLATERREACLNDRRSVAFETVFSAADKPEFVRRALALGYFVRIFFVGTERPEINAARVARRVLQGGHEVPIRKIVDRWARSIANAASVVGEVDRFYVYDNSVDDRRPTRAARRGRSRREGLWRRAGMGRSDSGAPHSARIMTANPTIAEATVECSHAPESSIRRRHAPNSHVRGEVRISRTRRGTKERSTHFCRAKIELWIAVAPDTRVVETAQTGDRWTTQALEDGEVRRQR